MANSYLYNTADPSCATGPSVFQVANEPVMIIATGLNPTDVLPIEVMTSAKCGASCPVPTEHWAPLMRGCPVSISGMNNQFIELIPGTYRINTSSLPASQPVAIVLQDAPTLKGIRPAFCYSTSTCPGGSESAPVCPPGTPTGVATTWG
jgi:hypothetical protein